MKNLLLFSIIIFGLPFSTLAQYPPLKTTDQVCICYNSLKEIASCIKKSKTKNIHFIVNDVSDSEILNNLPKGSKKINNKFLLPSGRTSIFHKSKNSLMEKLNKIEIINKISKFSKNAIIKMRRPQDTSIKSFEGFISLGTRDEAIKKIPKLPSDTLLIFDKTPKHGLLNIEVLPFLK